MLLVTSTLTIPHRFCGPPVSGNGGWTAGALAAHLGPVGRADTDPVRVMLRKPPPLDTALDVVVTDADDSAEGGPTAAATLGDVLVATATMAPDVIEVEPVGADVARAAEASFVGLTAHPFPSCFSCGPDRAPGDGLRIFPGRVDDDSHGQVRVAATWTPGADVDGATTWAALDCVGGWSGDLTERPMVLGSMTARVPALPRAGEEHVLVGSARGIDGRRVHTASTLYDSTGRVVAAAEHLWFTIDPKDFS